MSITVFDTGDSPGTDGVEDNREGRFYARVRDVESDYMAIVLRDTLIATRHWGAVRVMPETDPAGEILVTAEILRSDAVTLSLRVRVNDSRGKIWLDQEYADRATSRDYGYDQNYDQNDDRDRDSEDDDKYVDDRGKQTGIVARQAEGWQRGNRSRALQGLGE